MADNDVTVVIGAKIDQLISAVNEVKAHLSTVESSVNKINDTFKSLGSTIKTALIGAGIVAFIEQMGHAGLEAERAALRLGITARQVGELKTIARLTGTDFDAMTMSIERLSLGVQRSTRDAFAPQAEALRVLGLRAKDLIGLPADRYFERIADAVAKLNPGMNLNNALMVLGGRGITAMIPALLQGSEGFRRFREEAERNRVGLEGFAKAGAETHEKFTLLEMSIEGAGKQLFLTLKPGIDAVLVVMREVILWVRQWAATLKSDDVRTAMANFATVAGEMAIAVIGFFTTIVEKAQQIIDKLDGMKSRVKGIWDIVTFPAVIGEYAGKKMDEFLRGPLEEGVKKAEAATPDLERRIREVLARLREELLKGIRGTGIEGEISSFIDTVVAANEATLNYLRKNVEAMRQGQREGIEAQVERIKTSLDLEKGLFEQKKIIYDLDAALFNTTENTKFGRTITATRDMMREENDRLTQIRNLWPAHSKEWEKAEQERVKASQKYITEIVKLNADQIKTMGDKIREWTDALQSSFNSSLRGLLAGTTTFAEAFKKLLGDMIIFFIQFVEKMLFEWARGKAAELIVGQQAETAKVAAVVAGETAQTAAKATGAATRTGIEETSTVTVIGTKITEALGSIAASLAEAFAGLVAALVPVFGPAAPAAAVGIVAGVGATAYAMLPKLDVGAWEVPRDMVANIHAGEMVVPARQAEAIRSGGGFGGGINFNISAVDGAGMASWLRNGGAKMIAHAVSNAYQLNPTLRPRY